MKKRLLSLLLLACIFCLSLSSAVFANETEAFKGTYLYDTDTKSNTISPRYVPQCGKYATHDMKSRGWGTLQTTSGENIFINRACFQCKRCYLVFVSRGDPTLGEPIGYWATYQPNEEINAYGAFLTTDTYFYTDNTKLSGMSFR